MNSKELIAQLIEEGVPADTAQMFHEYHRNHPDIWTAFEFFALKAVESRRKFGAKAIIERIRWDIVIDKKGEFKVCNSYAPYYARAFIIKYPEHREFFRIKMVRGISPLHRTFEEGGISVD